MIGSGIAAGNGREVCGVVQSFTVAFSNLSVTQLVQAHLIKIPVCYQVSIERDNTSVRWQEKLLTC